MPATAALRVLHAGVPGRIRYRAWQLQGNPELAAALECDLSRIGGINSVRANPMTGSLLVMFAPEQAPGTWEQAIADALGNAPDPEQAEQERADLRSVLARALAGASGSLRSAKRLFDGSPRRSTAASGALRPARGLTSQLGRGNAPPGVSGRTWLTRHRRSPPQNGPQPAAAGEQPVWHVLEIGRVMGHLGAPGPNGMSREAAAARLAREGPNAIAAAPRRSELRIFFDQLTSTPVAMLGVSAVLSLATGGVGDAVAILAVLGINAAIGYATESGAERTIAALTHVPQPLVPLLRDGTACDVPVEQVVRGDVLLLRAGVFVAADARLIGAQDLTVDESSLTGESMAVAKATEPLDDGALPLGERVNMVFRGTLITGGSGQGLVVATGGSTQIGLVQALASGVEARLTPMQQQLDRLGRQLALGAGIACGATLGVGLLRGQAPLPMLRTAVSLGVAAVPEGLPTVAIITLALGLARMRKNRVIVRQLAAVETLGAVQVVCLDKTGTITVNRMTIVTAQAGLERFEVHEGAFRDERRRSVSAASADIDTLLRIAVLCNEVELETGACGTLLQGSPTESVLVELALAAGLDVRALRARHPLLAMQRRAEGRNYMSTLHGDGSGRLLAVKGRPSEVLALCSRYLRHGEVIALEQAARASIESDNERDAARALRVLGFAYLENAAATDAEPSQLVWVGLIGMQDPPREGVRDVIARFHQAGVRTVMITGDQSATARAVAIQVGLGASDVLNIIEAPQLDGQEPVVLQRLARQADVFARVSPAHKLQIVQALQGAGLVVAMTGDGVNDGPALKAADIGIAMGASGTNAAREMADVVLEDDQLRTLIAAIEQGRAIYDDIRKAVHFVLATNLMEILYTFTCVATGLGEPLTPLQLLWINLVTDVFPELALAAQPPESDVLGRPPRDSARPMFTTGDLFRIGSEGLVMTGGALAAYLLTARRSGPGPLAGTVGFTTVTLVQLLHALSARSETHTIFDREPMARNRWLSLAVAGTAAAQLSTNFVPPLRRLLGTTPMGIADWGTALAAAVGPFLVNEALKRVRRGAAQPDISRAIEPPSGGRSTSR